MSLEDLKLYGSSDPKVREAVVAKYRKIEKAKLRQLAYQNRYYWRKKKKMYHPIWNSEAIVYVKP